MFDQINASLKNKKHKGSLFLLSFHKCFNGIIIFLLNVKQQKQFSPLMMMIIIIIIIIMMMIKIIINVS